MSSPGPAWEPKKPETIEHVERRIDVWCSKVIKVEREGDTLAIQMKTPKGLCAWAMPIAMVPDLVSILAQSGSIVPSPGVGLVVNPQGVPGVGGIHNA